MSFLTIGGVDQYHQIVRNTCTLDGGVFPALKFKLHHYSVVPEKRNTSSADTELPM